jgi:hypothetical protein
VAMEPANELRGETRIECGVTSLVVFLYGSETDLYTISDILRLTLSCSLLFQKAKVVPQ